MAPLCPLLWPFYRWKLRPRMVGEGAGDLLKVTASVVLEVAWGGGRE